VSASIPPRQDVVDVPPPPRSKDDGVAIFACEHERTTHANVSAYLVAVKDPPKARPQCPTCGLSARHVGHDTAQRLLSLQAR
jgi:hypothetical protein